MDKAPTFDIRVFKTFLLEMGNQIDINCKGHQKCYNFLMEEVTQGRFSVTALVTYLFLQKERYNQNKKPEGAFTCTNRMIKRMMGGRHKDLVAKDMGELKSKGYVKMIGKRGNKTLYELPELIETKVDTEVEMKKERKEAPKETEHNQLKDNDMGNFIGTLEDFGIQETEPIITYANGEQEEEEVMVNPVIPKQEPIIKEEPKPDYPPTVDELLEPYKEYFGKKTPLGETPKEVQSDVVKKGLDNLYVYRLLDLKDAEKKEYEKWISSNHHLK